MKYPFKELVDISALQELTDDLYAAAAIPSAIITTGGEVLTESGGINICTEFHRKHPEAEKECIRSRTPSPEAPGERGAPAIFTCPHGLIYARSPIVIEGEHVADVVTGQVLLSPPDDAAKQIGRASCRERV